VCFYWVVVKVISTSATVFLYIFRGNCFNRKLNKWKDTLLLNCMYQLRMLLVWLLVVSFSSSHIILSSFINAAPGSGGFRPPYTHLLNSSCHLISYTCRSAMSTSYHSHHHLLQYVCGAVLVGPMFWRDLGRTIFHHIHTLIFYVTVSVYTASFR